MKQFLEQQKFFLGIVIGVLVGVVITATGFSISERSKEKDTGIISEVTPEEKMLTRETLAEEGDRVDIQDQPASITVQITSVTFASSGWVAIHETVNGLPTNILGAARFDEGVSSGSMELLRGTEPGGLYYARLYSDNGDRAFSPETDLLVVDISGNPIQDSFIATE